METVILLYCNAWCWCHWPVPVTFRSIIGESMESNCSMIEKIPPKGVSFSDFICTFPSLTLRYYWVYDISSPQTAVMAIWGLWFFSDFVVDKTLGSLRVRDFGPVRTYRCYPSHAFGVGPSRSRCHGRLRRPKSLTHPALSHIILIFLAFLCLRDNAPHFLLCYYLQWFVKKSIII